MGYSLKCPISILAAENIAKQWSLSKQEQDEFSVSSQNKCEAAQNSGEFSDEIVPVQVKQRRGKQPAQIVLQATLI